MKRSQGSEDTAGSNEKRSGNANSKHSSVSGESRNARIGDTSTEGMRTKPLVRNLC
jgi:hypothetical protein